MLSVSASPVLELMTSFMTLYMHLSDIRAFDAMNDIIHPESSTVCPKMHDAANMFESLAQYKITHCWPMCMQDSDQTARS